MWNRILYVILLGILIKFLLDVYVTNDDDDNNNNDVLIKNNNKKEEEEATGNNNDVDEEKTKLNVYTAEELKKICNNNKYFLAILGNVYDVTKGEKVIIIIIFFFIFFKNYYCFFNSSVIIHSFLFLCFFLIV